MPVTNGSDQNVFTAILVCPACHADLKLTNDYFICNDCGDRYALNGGIPYFAEPEAIEDDAADGVAVRKRYEWKYRGAQAARRYDDSFQSSTRKRQRTRREMHILERMLSSQSRCHTILDVPCGGGRLSEPVAAKTETLIEADLSPAQLDLALSRELGQQRGIVVSALKLPFADGSLDGVVCARLSHHLADAGERVKLLSELLRISRRFVIFSFTDRRSIRTLGRILKGRSVNPRAMGVSEIDQVAAGLGARVERIMTVSALGPRHRFALLTK